MWFEKKYSYLLVKIVQVTPLPYSFTLELKLIMYNAISCIVTRNDCIVVQASLYISTLKYYCFRNQHTKYRVYRNIKRFIEFYWSRDIARKTFKQLIMECVYFIITIIIHCFYFSRHTVENRVIASSFRFKIWRRRLHA